MNLNWNQSQKIRSKSYICGYCGHDIASEEGYNCTTKDNMQRNRLVASIYICHHCHQPTYFSDIQKQFPGPIFGSNVNHITNPDVNSLYNEARSCYTFSAFTSSVMCCRKLLMNIAVQEGAQEGKSFVEYVNFLDSNGHIPKNGKPWVDKIRQLGNEANHKIDLKSQEEAKLILTFTEMLLKFIYEIPGLLVTP